MQSKMECLNWLENQAQDAPRRPGTTQEASRDATRFDFEGQLGTMLATKINQKLPQTPPKTRLGAIVSIFRRPDRILAPFWLDFGRFWPSF